MKFLILALLLSSCGKMILSETDIQESNRKFLESSVICLKGVAYYSGYRKLAVMYHTPPGELYPKPMRCEIMK